MTLVKTTPFGNSQYGVTVRELYNEVLVAVTTNVKPYVASSETPARIFYIWVSYDKGTTWTQQQSITTDLEYNDHKKIILDGSQIPDMSSKPYTNQNVLSDTFKEYNSFYIPVESGHSSFKIKKISYNKISEKIEISENIDHYYNSPITDIYGRFNPYYRANYKMIKSIYKGYSNDSEYLWLATNRNTSVNARSRSDFTGTGDTSDYSSVDYSFFGGTQYGVGYPDSIGSGNNVNTPFPSSDWSHTGDNITKTNHNIFYVLGYTLENYYYDILYNGNTIGYRRQQFFTKLFRYGSIENEILANSKLIDGNVYYSVTKPTGSPRSSPTLFYNNNHTGIIGCDSEYLYAWQHGESNSSTNTNIRIRKVSHDATITKNSKFTNHYELNTGETTSKIQTWRGHVCLFQNDIIVGIILENHSSEKKLSTYLFDTKTNSWGEREIYNIK